MRFMQPRLAIEYALNLKFLGIDCSTYVAAISVADAIDFVTDGGMHLFGIANYRKCDDRDSRGEILSDKPNPQTPQKGGVLGVPARMIP
jgi:hypothetical protein